MQNSGEGKTRSRNTHSCNLIVSNKDKDLGNCSDDDDDDDRSSSSGGDVQQQQSVGEVILLSETGR